MKELEQLVRRFADGTDARWWIGARPAEPYSDVPRQIAGLVGYPTSEVDPFASGSMVELSRAAAAEVLAIAGTCSLAYGDTPPRRADVYAAALALMALGEDAVFLTNGRWLKRRSAGWAPMTSATFDCGVIGFGAVGAFIFWVEEED